MDDIWLFESDANYAAHIVDALFPHHVDEVMYSLGIPADSTTVIFGRTSRGPVAQSFQWAVDHAQAQGLVDPSFLCALITTELGPEFNMGIRTPILVSDPRYLATVIGGECAIIGVSPTGEMLFSISTIGT
jgi:hypothetical protein